MVRLFVARLALALAVLFAAAPALGQSKEFVDCINGLDPKTSPVNCDLAAWLNRVKSNCKSGGSGITAEELAAAVCRFYSECTSVGGTCEEKLQAVKCAVATVFSGRELTPDDIRAIAACLNCTMSSCTSGPGGGLAATCASSTSNCGATADACEALRQTLRNATYCFFKSPGLQPGETLDETYQRRMADAVCRYLDQCKSGSTPPMSCKDAIKCIANSSFAEVLDAKFFCELLKCSSACASELCSFDGKPASGQVRCDINQDGKIDCDDLKIMIEMLKACRCAGNLAPPSTADIVALACQFWGKDGCVREGEGTVTAQTTVECVDIAACLQEIEDIPYSQICAIMSGACSGESGEPGCSSHACDLLTLVAEPPGELSSEQWATICAELNKHGLEAFLRVLMCCPGADGLTDAQLAAILCALAEHCGLSCADVAEALEAVFGYDRAKKIFEEFRKCHEGCDDFDDELRKAGDKKRTCKKGSKSKALPWTRTANPVELATGEKLEFATDIDVALPGGAFTLSRSYSSGLVSSSADYSKSIFGAEWTMPVAQFIEPSSTTLASATWLKLHSETANEYREFIKDTSTGVFKPDTGDQETIELIEGVITLNDGSTDEAMLWKMTIPGEGTREYVAGPDVTGGSVTDSGNVPFVEDREGLLVRETTIHGRRIDYTYAQHGTTFNPAMRPDTIYLAMFGAETRSSARARVVFNWSFKSDINKGRLRRIDVFRPSGGTQVLTNQVEYRYKVSGDGAADTVGSDGDLIQVVTRELTDSVDGSGEPIFRSLVTQYRYHRGIEVISDANTTPLKAHGAAHQLKAVLLPEQIEYFAQKYYTGVLGGNQPDSVENAAAKLLTYADEDTALASESRITLDFAAKVVGYNFNALGTEDLKVAAQFLQASCGCSGAAQGVKETYEFLAWGSPNLDHKTAIVREFTENGSGGYNAVPFRVTRHDLKEIDGTPYLLSKAVSASVNSSTSDGSTWWVWGYHYDSNKNLTHEFFPSSFPVSGVVVGGVTVPCYNPATTGTPASFTVSGTGLVNFYAYNSENRLTEKRVGSTDTTTASSYTLVEKTTYYSGGTALTSYLPSKVERYRWPGSAAADDVETIDYDYGFRTSPDLAWVKTTYEAELTTENGPGGFYYTYQLINNKGETEWVRAEDLALRSFTYDNLTGAVLTTTGNASSSGITTSNYGSSAPLVTGWGSLPGGTLTRTYTVDLLGRRTSAVRPAGSGTPVTTRTVRQMLPNTARVGVLYYAEVDLPHKWTEMSIDNYAGPASITWKNAASKVLASADFSVTFNTSDPVAYALGTQLSKSTIDHALTGLPLSSTRWRSIAYGLYGTTTFAYDARGNVETKTTPNGTIERYAYDLLDRVISVEVGTNAATSGGNMKQVSATYWDFDTTSSSGPTQGIGDGNPTLTRVWFGDGSGDYRDYVRVYDHRNRLVQARGARDSGGTSVGPHEVRVYDNLDRLVERAMYNSLTGLTSSQGGDHNDDITASASNRTVYSRTAYTQRGGSFRTAVATSPTLSLGSGLRSRNTTALSSELVSAVWRDGPGRTVTKIAPNSPAMKNEYDGHGRVTRSFVTDRDGASVSNHSTTGDQVVEQTNYTYDDRDRIAYTTRYLRRHDDTGTGSTRGPLDASGVTAVKMFSGMIYDGADRVTKNVNLGTNVTGNAALTAGGSAPSTWPPSSLPSYPDAIVESRSYNTRGLTAWNEDALGRKTKFKYDDLDRQVAVIENATLNPETEIDWSVSLNRWEVDGAVLSSSSPDVNRVTSTVYDASGNVVKLVAHQPGTTSGTEAVQITQYEYAVIAGSAGNPMDSLLASNDILKEATYPQEGPGGSPGEPGTTNDYKVRYAYNRLGELRATTDQNGTRHDYTRDAAGRVTLDSVGAFGTDIDQAVKSLAITYDTSGRIREVISASDTAGMTPVNGVAFSYNALWQPSNVYQNHTGAALSGGSAATGTKWVGYSYNTVSYVAGGENNFSRLNQTTYPDASTVLTNSYNLGTLDSRISRIYAIRINPAGASLQELVNYKRIGMSMTAVVDYPTPDVQLDYTFSHSDRRRAGMGTSPQTSGTYPGYDGFGRVVRHPWLDGAVSDSSGGNRPAILEHVHGYDAASNRLSKLDGRTGASWANRDWEYAYDGLNRLSEAKRGVRGSSSWVVAGGSQQWVVDMLGNWTTRRTDLAGNGVYTDYADRSEARDHNQANELLQRATTTSGTTVTLPLTYDDAGNMREEKINGAGGYNRYTHDAWGRLVKVEMKNTSGTYVTRVVYAYNGLHWRIDKAFDYDGDGGMDRRTAFWYDASWRMVQEDQADVYNDNPSAPGHTPFYQSFQQVWGARYIDEAVARLQLDGSPGSQTQGPLFFQLGDAQFSVSVVLDEAGAVIDRMRYTPYGEVSRTDGCDVNGDSSVDSTDYDTLIDPLAQANSGAGTPITASSYTAEADINRDGVVDAADYSLCGTRDGTMTEGTKLANLSYGLSYAGPRNSVGYCGYLFNEETGHYTVRYRHYHPVLGRWLERDPAGYVEGVNLYEYTKGMVNSLTDPLGLCACQDGGAPALDSLSAGLLKGILSGTITLKDLVALGMSAAAAAALIEAVQHQEQLKEWAREQVRKIEEALKKECPKGPSNNDWCKKLKQALGSMERSLKSLTSMIKIHEDKLAKFLANPDLFDNLGHLKNAGSDQALRQRIIDGRKKHLETEIRGFRLTLERLEAAIKLIKEQMERLGC